jgi:3-deoxy-manno-octulosonate cytidylyltransferase (CMP-KDO synthetase)
MPPKSGHLNPTSTNLSNWLIVIPARLNSERLPRKPLANLAGKPLVVRVFENLAPMQAQGAEVVVAVDHDETAQVCTQFKIPWVMTKESHESGTDRCAEVAQKFINRLFILNVQGDEPFVNSDDLRHLMAAMENSEHQMGTLGISRDNWDSYINPNLVKIVVAHDKTAIYFSRAAIPYNRDAFRAGVNNATFTEHIGVYAFKRDSLENFCALPKSSLEKTEKLEQLRAISAGWKIFVSTAKFESLGIDTPEDLAAAQRKFHE